MPDDTVFIVENKWKVALDLLEDYSIDSQQIICENLNVIHNALEKGEAPYGVEIAERLLAVCAREIDGTLANIALNIVICILKKVKDGAFEELPDLIPSALAVIKITKPTTSQCLVTKLLKTLQYYPDDILAKIAVSNWPDFMKLLKLKNIHIPDVMQLLQKFIKNLPSEELSQFIKSKVNIWFAEVIPSTMTYYVDPKQTSEIPIETLELLTDKLMYIDYANCQSWLICLEKICNYEYTTIMKRLLEIGSNIWHRLWIVFIKLLKNQITRNSNSTGSPINSMLIIVETAFKMDVLNRCRAFKCWESLIDNFCTETNESYVAKRLKLLIVPLKSNNAKVEETAIAKFNCWWHLIHTYQTRLDRFSSMVLIPFLHFCFGRSVDNGKNSFVPGKISDNLKRKCLEAFVEIVGHVNCEGCTDLPHLQSKLLSTPCLVEHWTDWSHSLATAIKISDSYTDAVVTQQVSCLWRSFLMTIGDMPDNALRRDLISELLNVLSQLVECCALNMKFADTVFDILIQSLLNDEPKIRQFLGTEFGKDSPLHKIVVLILDPSFELYYKRFSTKDLVLRMRPLADLLLNKCLRDKQEIELLLKDISPNDTSLIFWTAMVDSICDSELEICSLNLCPILLWPLSNLEYFEKTRLAALTWNKLYKLKFSTMRHTQDISNALVCDRSTASSHVYFKLACILAILRCGLVNGSSTDYDRHVELLVDFLKKTNDYELYQQMLPLLVDTIVVMLNNLTKTLNTSFAEHTFTCLKHLLQILGPSLKAESASTELLVFTQNIIEAMDELFRSELYLKSKSLIINNLIEYSSLLDKEFVVKNILPIMKMFLTRATDKDIPIEQKIDNTLILRIQKAIESIELKQKTPNKTETLIHNAQFNTPSTVPKTQKKILPSIIKTVVENGEEYVVVKSDWKFNPRKLTEAQKEKLQRKREDIPALYQDLSQSQDEFKLQTWKTDSQDGSSTNSKSNTLEGPIATVVLTREPSIDIVPNIIKNLCTESDKNSTAKIDDKNESHLFSPKNTKSPRMALKDRVFRNVRNLIEKSNPNGDSNAQTHNNPNSPVNKLKADINVIKSAPPALSSERPSRLKRKPKKFDDTEIFALKKSCRSLSNSDSQELSIETSAISNKSEATNPSDAQPVENSTELQLLDTKNDQSVKIDITLNELPEISVETTNHDKSNHTRPNDIDVITKCDSKVKSIISSDVEVKINSDDVPVNESVKEVIIKNVLINKDSIDIATKEVNYNLKETEALENKISTPNMNNAKRNNEQKSSKKNSVKKSRIEKELAIDMVEGHPYLKIQSDKRVTRKALISSANTTKRKSLSEKINNSKIAAKSKIDRKLKSKKLSGSDVSSEISVTVSETQENLSNENILSEDFQSSEDIIESSQDSTLTTISVRSTKKTTIKVPENTCDKKQIHSEECLSEELTELNNDIIIIEDTPVGAHDTKDDIDLSRNRTVVNEEKSVFLTDNMDTESVHDVKESSDDVIIVNDEEFLITVGTENSIPGQETQEIANADTQPTNPMDFTNFNISSGIEESKSNEDQIVIKEVCIDNSIEDKHLISKDLSDKSSKSYVESMEIDEQKETNEEDNAFSSPLKDDAQRKQDFLNNTLEISPIRTMSPQQEKKSPSPETSSDYVVIKLSSPVSSNGEPLEKCASPEFFTEDKISPDKRNQSPPPVEVNVPKSSPSSSLSLKKNRSQVRSGGRAAQMLGLCVPDRLQSILSTERAEVDETKRSSPSNSAAKRNLRMLYNITPDNIENCDETEENENFLKFKRTLPSVESSPSVPILKRKLGEISDETIVSPASKRKRVSFHDPPVSTTIAVQKYIEPCGIRSPQNSVQKRQERLMRSHTNLKSPKRLDNVFKLDNALTKAVESFADDDITVGNDDTQIVSLEQTPAVEIVKTSELNDIDAIFPALIDCTDPIENIAGDLSSPAMKTLFIKQLQGKVDYVCDIAKMTELEVNRLCIKAPKVQVVKKVLLDYAEKMKQIIIEENKLSEEHCSDIDCVNLEPVITDVNVEVQTENAELINIGVQTSDTPLSETSTQTNISTSHCHTQTVESGFKPTAEIINNCIVERSDFVENLGELLPDASLQHLSSKLSVSSITEMLMTKATVSDIDDLYTTLLKHQSEIKTDVQEGNKQLRFIQDYIFQRFETKDLILFCSQLLKKLHDKPS